MKPIEPTSGRNASTNNEHRDSHLRVGPDQTRGGAQNPNQGSRPGATDPNKVKAPNTQIPNKPNKDNRTGGKF